MASALQNEHDRTERSTDRLIGSRGRRRRGAAEPGRVGLIARHVAQAGDVLLKQEIKYRRPLLRTIAP
jgi:hypothetical protein